MPTIPNLCGASLELDDTLTKLEDLESEITSQIDAAASTAAAAATSAVTEMKNALDGLALDLPELPPLNLQAEITSLLALPKTTLGEVLAYTSKLANIETNFGTELTSAGKSLTTLVTDATSALSGGGDLCAAVPNFEKAADGSAPAVEKAAAVLQAAVAPLAEEPSKIVANPNVEATRAALKEKTEKFATPANTEGFKGIGADAAKFSASDGQEVTEKSKEVTVSHNGKSITKKVVTAKESVVRTKVTGGGTTTATRANVSSIGFSSRPKNVNEMIRGPKEDAFGDGLLSGGGDIDEVGLKHNATSIRVIKAWNPVGGRHNRTGAIQGKWVHIYEAGTVEEIAAAERASYIKVNTRDPSIRDTFTYDKSTNTVNINTTFSGPYPVTGYDSHRKRYKGVVYRIRYAYNDTYDVQYKKAALVS